MSGEIRIADCQAFARARGLVSEMLDDAPGLGLRRGDWLIIEPCDRFVCDARYLLKSQEVVRLMSAAGGVNLTRGDGGSEIVTHAEVAEMVLGYARHVTRKVSS
ncbi:hypothetical protein OU426_04045 [Frigidibacter sp. RF13]|uniref:hypothetical protein n=1 Tax=Frigidibacter sp. RF13 TaxID=2997340 RepID=UPI00226DC5A1|nr:hypothetical protein [Frigidibacter sp. RF13]MCY1126017.1 hypothetical protein [Frigidibacter sp. RF13]